MSLIQPLKFKTLKTGCFKIPRLQTPICKWLFPKQGLQLPLSLDSVMANYIVAQKVKAERNCLGYVRITIFTL